MNLGQIRASVRSNLNDAGVTFYDDDSINQAIQDGYNEVAAKCRCIQKSAPISQIANVNYYDFLTLGVTDFLGTFAIYNLATNFWLRDDVSLRDFDRIRRDWELWRGQPQFWTPHTLKYDAIAPCLASTSGEQFTLWYWATAPSLVLDTDVPLIAADMQTLLEFYATADRLETAEEMTKAGAFWKQYMDNREQYKLRCSEISRAELLLRV